MNKTLNEVCEELDVLTGERYRSRIAVVLPPERVIAHDDEAWTIRHQFYIGHYCDLAEMEHRNARVRFKAIGAVVFPCQWVSRDCVPRHKAGPEGDQPWILIKPEFMGDRNIVAKLREAAAADQEWWTTKGRAISMGVLEEEAHEEDAGRTRARKAAVTRKRNAHTVLLKEVK